MEYNNTEIAVVSEAAAESVDLQIQELNELQLALIGGGAGEASFG
jgi:hypothetical protein